MNAPASASPQRPPAPPGWRRVEKSLVRDLLFRDFDQARGRLLAKVAALIEVRAP